MKVSKPKENQLLFEDDNLKQLKLEVESKTGLSKSVLNEIYEGDRIVRPEQDEYKRTHIIGFKKIKEKN